MHYVVAAASKLTAQGAYKGDLVSQWSRRKDDHSTQRRCFIVELTFLAESTIKPPVQRDPVAHPEPKHPHEPVLNCSAIETFDNMENSHKGRDLSRTRPLIGPSIRPWRDGPARWRTAAA